MKRNLITVQRQFFVHCIADHFRINITYITSTPDVTDILTSQVLQMSHTPGKVTVSDTKGMSATYRATFS